MEYCWENQLYSGAGCKEERKKAEAEEYQARLARASERAAEPVFKRTGKPSMARSTLCQKVKQNKGADAARQAEAEPAEIY